MADNIVFGSFPLVQASNDSAVGGMPVLAIGLGVTRAMAIAEAVRKLKEHNRAHPNEEAIGLGVTLENAQAHLHELSLEALMRQLVEAFGRDLVLAAFLTAAVDE